MARKERRAYQRTYMETWRYSTLDRCLRTKLTDARKRARRKGIRCSITLPYVSKLYEKQKGECALTGWSMTFDRPNMRKTTVSIDRVNCLRGYVRGNVRLVCDVANTARWQMDDITFLKMCSAVVARQVELM